MSATLAEQIDARHQRRLRGLRACGVEFATVVCVLGGGRVGEDPTPAQLEHGMARLAAWSGRTMRLADLELPLGWLRLARVVGFFHNATRWLRPRRKPIHY